MSYADQKETSPPLGAASCETVITFGWSWEAQRNGAIRRPECGLAVPEGCVLGGPAGVASYADQKEGSTSLGAANCETATTFVGS